MVSVSIRTLLVLFFLWKTSFGQPTNDTDLFVSETFIRPSPGNDSRQNFSISFQLKRVPADGNIGDGFEKRQLQFAILDKLEKQMLDKKSIIFDDSLMKMMNYDGKYLGVTKWTKFANRTKIQVDGYFAKNANETVFSVEELNKSKRKQRLVHRKIIFDDKIKLNVFMETARGEKADEINSGSVVTIFCKARSTKYIKPKFEGLQFLNQTIKTIQTNNEVQLTFRAKKENHFKTIWCVAGQARRSLTIKILHAPAAVRTKPAERGTLVAGGHLRCFAVDGYPPPKVTWLAISVPPNGDKFHRIYQTTNNLSTFILKENAPVGSAWMIRCRSTNRYGNFTLTMNFTVEANQTSLLSGRLSKLEAKLQQLQNENTQKVFVQRQTNLETKMEKFMETMVHKISSVKEELSTSRAESSRNYRGDCLMIDCEEDGKVLLKIVEELKKIKYRINNVSSKAENNKSDLMQQLEELRKMMNASRRIQEGVIGRLDKLAGTVKARWFVWRIEGINEIARHRVGFVLDSRPFYSEGTGGYKLNLRFEMLFDVYYMAFHLNRGKDDDRLQWPMKLAVFIEVVDEQTTLPINSQYVSLSTVKDRPDPDFRYPAYDKPTSDKNFYGDVVTLFRSYAKLKSTPGAIYNDAMTVRCRLIPQ